MHCLDGDDPVKLKGGGRSPVAGRLCSGLSLSIMFSFLNSCLASHCVSS